MKCVVCKNGETEPGLTSVTLERGPVTVIFKSVPARVCDNCGEEYVDEATAGQLLEMLDEAEKGGVVLDIRDFTVAKAAVSQPT